MNPAAAMLPGMQTTVIHRLHAADALLPSGWARDVLIEWRADGRLMSVTPGAKCETWMARAAGPVVPGLPNLHSHAFQRVFAGLAEFRGAGADSFWSWRERMYRVANVVTPDELEAIATWLYIEMLDAGYTSVCEFHYLHNDPDGRPYADDTTMAATLMAAAVRVGIGITLLPVLYQHSGFGGLPPAEGQRRFVRSVDGVLALSQAVRQSYSGPMTGVGAAVHSLRAVTPEALRDVLAGAEAGSPVHIHIAEQQREVEECLAWSGQRPVEWLLNHAPVSARWCLVHATHVTPDETRRAAATGAVAGLCPSTEANLGDGSFDLSAWTVGDGGEPGRWGIGSDSHVTVNAADELRLLEYSQRLRTGRRNVAASARERHTATALTLAAVAGGAAVSGRPVGGLSPKQRADFVVLDAAHPLIAGLSAPDALDAHVFASHRNSAVSAVVVGGHEVVRHGRHRLHGPAAAAFVRARAAILARL